MQGTPPAEIDCLLDDPGFLGLDITLTRIVLEFE